ncbi:MAG: type II toxin-antitoxin system RelE/ParE family toxin [Planctomycetes bacterium]|nr:type II toxin-antitoxin system RelE/ParE family toxin [Planctomycetota bacterium]
MTTGGRLYKIEFTAASRRQLERVVEPGRTRLARTIAQLAVNPRPPGCRKLEAPVPLYRVRVGDYRVIYAIADMIVTVTVTKVGHRSLVYRKR